MSHRNATLPPFLGIATVNPTGFTPGTYWAAYYTRDGELVKVSRFSPYPKEIREKIIKYERRYEKGDRNWPEVGRDREIAQSEWVVLTEEERRVLYEENVARIRIREAAAREIEASEIVEVDFTKAELRILAVILYSALAAPDDRNPVYNKFFGDIQRIVESVDGSFAQAKALSPVQVERPPFAVTTRIIDKA